MEFWGEAVNAANYLHRMTPNNSLIKRDDQDRYKAPYNTPHEMLLTYGKPKHDAEGKDISKSYKAPTHHLRRFGCHVSKLIPEAQRSCKFSPGSKLDGAVPDVNKERNAYITCLPPLTNEKSATDTLGLQREEMCVEELENRCA